ncbi:hypothetical protein VST7929_00950 [Vibrio stylophorae]|uniref:HAD family hydrolase n=1 Tax=Vibrio stylophorae TaxID=659351 RepID=A0ABM8ZS70_9VIBR|nr:HAD hydrolase-like protein [Vibrio stylophorae]CAH0533097.1 hypothetical protein VST7929_00950 [Vibrio stylophorae]
MYDVLKSKKLVIFDLDGTLVSTENGELEFFFNKLEAEVNLSIDKNIGFYSNRTLCSVLNSLPVENKNVLFEKMEGYMAEFVSGRNWIPIACGVDCYNAANEMCIDNFIVTGNFRRSSAIKMRRSGIDVNTDNLFVTSLMVESKLDVISKLISDKYIPQDILSVGDSEYDLEIARRLGIDFFLIS